MSDLLSPDMNLALLKATQGDSKNSAAQLKNAKNLEKIEHAAQEFEAVFVAEMMKPMFEGLETDGPFGGGKGEEVFRGMMLQEYGKIISQTGRIGVADQVKSAMIQMQSEQDLKNTLNSNTTSTNGALSDE